MSAIRINRPMVFHHTWNGDMLTVEAVDPVAASTDTAYIFGSRDEWQDIIEAISVLLGAVEGQLVRLEMTAEEASRASGVRLDAEHVLCACGIRAP